MNILIKNGYLVNPAEKKPKKSDILIKNDKIVSLGTETLSCSKIQQLKQIDATGLYIFPAFFDMHTHLREPGFEYKEDIASGSLAAAHGGYASVCCMANTKPVNDSVEITRLIKEKIKEEAVTNVFIIGAVSKNLEGMELADLYGMKKEGVIAFSDDGNSLSNEKLLEKAMIIAKELDVPIISHCEDFNLSKNGVVDKGSIAIKHGLPIISPEAEEKIIERDIKLAKKTGCRLHIAHVSTRRSVELISAAKLQNVKITCEVTPHHLILTEEDIVFDNANFKMKPPLRSVEDRDALILGLKEGIIDAIATDHAPHSLKEKQLGLANAPFGVVGLETAFPVLYELVKEGILSLPELVSKLTIGPAKIINQDLKCEIKEGEIANLTIIDLNCEREIKEEEFLSKSKNSPFIGKKVHAKVLYTICNGKIAYSG